MQVFQVLGRWEAKLVARLLATAALWVRFQTSLKNTKGRHKQRIGQHTVARQKIYKNNYYLLLEICYFHC
jgi:hypothetical protein